jgi:carboxylesterase type B
MSGSALVDAIIGDKDSVKKLWSKKAEKINCKQEFDRGSTDCFSNTNVSMGENPLVIYGDQLLPQKPSVMLKSGNYKKEVNLLMGTTDDEGSVFVSLLMDSKQLSNITKAKVEKYISQLFSAVSPKFLINSDEIYKLYASQLPEHNYDAIRRSLGVGLGDYIIGCPTIEFGKLCLVAIAIKVGFISIYGPINILRHGMEQIMHLMSSTGLDRLFVNQIIQMRVNVKFLKN